MTLEKRFGRVVRQWRTEHGVTQEQLAERLGLHRNYIGDIERGERNISLGVMSRIGVALGYERSADLLNALRPPAYAGTERRRVGPGAPTPITGRLPEPDRTGPAEG